MSWTTRLSMVLLVAGALAACGGEIPEDERLAHDDDTEPFFRRPYPNGTYVLTTFGGPSDSSAYGHKTACGPRVYGKKFYSTGVYGWGCNARARVTANGKCAIVDVIDNGPAAWVETKSANKCGIGRILDVSPAVSRHLFGTSALGWSSCRKVKVERVSNSMSPGPCASSVGSWTPPSYPALGTDCQVGSRKGECKNTSTSSCASGWKSGYCSGPNNIKCCLDGSSSGGSSTVSGVGTSCKIGSQSGTCKDSYSSSCSAGFKSGYCSGPSQVKCCLEPSSGGSTVNGVGTSCKVGSKSGTCQDSYASSCTSGFKSGYCSGPNQVKCCLD